MKILGVTLRTCSYRLDGYRFSFSVFQSYSFISLKVGGKGKLQVLRMGLAFQLLYPNNEKVLLPSKIDFHRFILDDSFKDFIYNMYCNEIESVHI